MLPAERRQYILNELYKNKAVAVNEMAETLGVTPMTIRRDLQLLEENGLVEKSHGGAVLTESIVKEATYRNRKLAHITEKRRIAAAALPLIESSMSVFLDAGTTNYELAALMVGRHWDAMTIVTNDLAIAQLLLPVPGIRLVMLGGSIDAESASTCGSFAVKMAREFHFDLCFMGTQAVTPDWRIMSANLDKVDLKRACVAAADKTIVLTDSSKFHKHKLYYLFALWDVDMVITDYNATKEEQELMAEHHVEYVLA